MVNVERAPDAVVDGCNASNEQLLSLCGGIPDDALTYIEMEVIVEQDCYYGVYVKTNKYDLIRTIDLRRGIITNTSLDVNDGYRRQGLATRILENQIAAAREMNMNEIILIASKGVEFDGYLVWGRLGFTMVGEDQVRFERLCRNHGREESNLYELLKTEEGKEFWRTHGYTWLGRFNLEGDSDNISDFEEYLNE
jgi:GNAT superfamily N-acetyltransferase